MANISKQERDRMLAFLEELRIDNQDNEKIEAINAIELAITEKKYGLVWEEHTEQVDNDLKHNVPVFTEDESKKIVTNNEKYNFILEGDNLHSLYLLQKTHTEQVDVIYIDPPYNTKKEGFTFSDKLVDGNDSFRHSKWISFMERRLFEARKLLNDTGVIFISIDENEFAQLKLLCDEVFGEECFIENIIWNKRVPKNDKGIGNIHEYILIYAKSPTYKYKFMSEKEGIEDIENLMKECREKDLSPAEAQEKLKNLYRKNKYPRAITLYNNIDNNYNIFGKINMSWPNGNTFGPRYEVLHPLTKKPVKIPDRGWRWSEETFNSIVNYENISVLNDGSVICGGIWFSKDENMQPSSVKYLKEVSRMLLRSIISLKSDGGVVLENVFGKKNIFAYPKPVTLIKLLIDSITYDNKNALILDFFAGSGTTGHAVEELNQEDQGNRNYILCTNNENNIAEEVTYSRLKKIQKVLPHNLKYFKTDYIPKFSDEFVSDKLKYHIQELIELEYGIDLTSAKRYLVLDEIDLISFFDNETSEYSTIYISNDVLLSREQEKEIKRNNIDIVTVPDYYFSEEMKEVGEL